MLNLGILQLCTIGNPGTLSLVNFSQSVTKPENSVIGWNETIRASQSILKPFVGHIFWQVENVMQLFWKWERYKILAPARKSIQVEASSAHCSNYCSNLPLSVNIQFALPSFRSKSFRKDGFIKCHTLCSHLSLSQRNFNIVPARVLRQKASGSLHCCSKKQKKSNVIITSFKTDNANLIFKEE